jgi:hypothetical protein
MRMKKFKLPRVIDAAEEAVGLWLDETVKSRGGIKMLTENEHEQWDEINSHAVDISIKALTDIRLERFRVLTLNRKPLIEQSLTCKMPKSSGWKGFHFTVDLAVEDLEVGGNWILDYKVRKQFTPVDAEEVNIQFPCYQHGLAENGIETIGSIMYQILSKPPSQPSLNKDGSMSRAKIATTWPIYRAALVANGLDPRDYLEMQAKLDTAFSRETREPRAEKVVETIWNQLVVPAAMSMAVGMAPTPRTGMFNGAITCNGCWARAFCLSEFRGDDIDFLLSTDYVDQLNPKERILLNPGDVIFDA